MSDEKRCTCVEKARLNSPPIPAYWRDPWCELHGNEAIARTEGGILKVGNVVVDASTGRCGRVVVMHPGHANQRAYAWIQRNCQDGTVEREACWLDDLVIGEP